jgi:uncharacterized protein (TIGR03083 family)
MLDPDRLRAVLRSDVVRLAAVPDDALDRAVPTCPGWTVTDLFAHLGRVHHRALDLLEGAPFVPLDEWPATPVGPPAVAWSREVAAELVALVDRVAPDATTHNWLGEVPAWFWMRRMTQETSLHRWDVDHALGGPAHIDADVGADGVDELLTWFLPRIPVDAWVPVVDPPGSDRSGAARASRTIHLHATDTEGEWMITLGPDGASVVTGHGKGDVAVRAGGATLELLVWNRAALDATGIEVFGDDDLAARFLAVTRF